MADIELTITVDEDVAREFVAHYRVGRLAAPISRAITAALPKPRPAEPMGLGAVVRDGKEKVWVRADDESNPWRRVDVVLFGDYAYIPGPIEVLSEGVIL